jgi:hypothetical protein
MYKIRKHFSTIMLIIILGSMLWYVTHLFVRIDIKDNITKQYVKEPGIVLNPEQTLIAGPGTDGRGPLVFSLFVPKLINITSQVNGYKDKTVKLFLFPGRSYTIWVDKSTIE